MQLKFFTIPILPGADEEDKLNKFLRSVRVLEIKREIVSYGDGAYWAVCVLYLPQNHVESSVGNTKEKVDYKNILSEIEFKRFCQLRKIRKQIADNDAVPAFAVFTDYELSEISRMEEITLTALKSVNGIGVKKIDKYGNQFCELMASIIQDETEGKAD